MTSTTTTAEAIQPEMSSSEETRVRRGRRRMLSSAITILAGIVVIAILVLGLPLGSTPQQGAPFWTGEWSQTGNMVAGHRAGHTATLLPDGRVLVVGGDTDELASSEYFDSRTGTWSTGGDLSSMRVDHTATLLPDGTVLVVGGRAGSAADANQLQTAELYDHASQQWTETTDEMSVARDTHTATLMSDGTVLIAGGNTDQTRAERYDPTSRTWLPSGDMSVSRRYHAATLLPTGKVLVTGGLTLDDRSNRLIATNSVEIYDPASNSWSTGSNAMATARAQHIAILLPNGKVLVAGGIDASGEPVASAEVYDPTSNTWAPIDRMTTSRSNFTATLLGDGRLLAIGGCGTTCRESAELYDPEMGRWRSVPNMMTPRNFHTATLLPDGRVLIAGGNCDCADLTNGPGSTELFAPAPVLRLPWSVSTTDGAAVWYLSAGPHCNVSERVCPQNTVRYAIDFAPPRLADEDPCAQERMTRGWVVAAASGEVRFAGDNLVEIHHGFGFRTGYYHLVDIQVSRGDRVQSGDKLGRPSCMVSPRLGGSSSGVQLLFYTCQLDAMPDVEQDFCGPIDSGQHVRSIEGVVVGGWEVFASKGKTQGNRRGKLVRIGEVPRNSTADQCGLDERCRTNEGQVFRNDLPPQLLKNASFENENSADSSPSDWRTNRAQFSRSDAVPAHSGRFAGRFSATDDATGVVSQVVDGLTAGTDYAFQSWVNIPDTTDEFAFTMRITWRDANRSPIVDATIADITSDTNGDWRSLTNPSDVFTAPPGAISALVTIKVQSLNGTIYIDDLLLVDARYLTD